MNGHGNEYPRRVKATQVVNGEFGPGMFALPGGWAKYDSVWMADGGAALYLTRVEPAPDIDGKWAFKITRRWIPWDAEVMQYYTTEGQ